MEFFYQQEIKLDNSSNNGKINQMKDHFIRRCMKRGQLEKKFLKKESNIKI